MEHAVSVTEMAAIIGFKEIELFALRRELSKARAAQEKSSGTTEQGAATTGESDTPRN